MTDSRVCQGAERVGGRAPCDPQPTDSLDCERRSTEGQGPHPVEAGSLRLGRQPGSCQYRWRPLLAESWWTRTRTVAEAACPIVAERP